MLNAIIIVVAVVLAGYLAFSKRLTASSSWKAIVTPLAPIMGSDFFVSAPLPERLLGEWSSIVLLVTFTGKCDPALRVDIAISSFGSGTIPNSEYRTCQLTAPSDQ